MESGPPPEEGRRDGGESREPGPSQGQPGTPTAASPMVRDSPAATEEEAQTSASSASASTPMISPPSTLAGLGVRDMVAEKVVLDKSAHRLNPDAGEDAEIVLSRFGKSSDGVRKVAKEMVEAIDRRRLDCKRGRSGKPPAAAGTQTVKAAMDSLPEATKALMEQMMRRQAESLDPQLGATTWLPPNPPPDVKETVAKAKAAMEAELTYFQNIANTRALFQLAEGEGPVHRSLRVLATSPSDVTPEMAMDSWPRPMEIQSECILGPKEECSDIRFMCFVCSKVCCAGHIADRRLPGRAGGFTAELLGDMKIRDIINVAENKARDGDMVSDWAPVCASCCVASGHLPVHPAVQALVEMGASSAKSLFGEVALVNPAEWPQRKGNRGLLGEIGRASGAQMAAVMATFANSTHRFKGKTRPGASRAMVWALNWAPSQQKALKSPTAKEKLDQLSLRGEAQKALSSIPPPGASRSEKTTGPRRIQAFAKTLGKREKMDPKEVMPLSWALAEAGHRLHPDEGWERGFGDPDSPAFARLLKLQAGIGSVAAAGCRDSTRITPQVLGLTEVPFASPGPAFKDYLAILTPGEQKKKKRAAGGEGLGDWSSPDFAKSPPPTSSKQGPNDKADKSTAEDGVGQPVFSSSGSESSPEHSPRRREELEKAKSLESDVEQQRKSQEPADKTTELTEEQRNLARQLEEEKKHLDASQEKRRKRQAEEAEERRREEEAERRRREAEEEDRRRKEQEAKNAADQAEIRRLEEVYDEALREAAEERRRRQKAAEERQAKEAEKSRREEEAEKRRREEAEEEDRQRQEQEARDAAGQLGLADVRLPFQDLGGLQERGDLPGPGQRRLQGGMDTIPAALLAKASAAKDEGDRRALVNMILDMGCQLIQERDKLEDPVLHAEPDAAAATAAEASAYIKAVKAALDSVTKVPGRDLGQELFFDAAGLRKIAGLPQDTPAKKDLIQSYQDWETRLRKKLEVRTPGMNLKARMSWKSAHPRPFDGRPSEWHKWRRDWERALQSDNIVPGARLSLLLELLQGTAASEVLRFRAVLNDGSLEDQARAYEDAMSSLQARYGDADEALAEQMSRISSLPQLAEGDKHALIRLHAEMGAAVELLFLAEKGKKKMEVERKLSVKPDGGAERLKTEDEARASVIEDVLGYVGCSIFAKLPKSVKDQMIQAENQGLGGSAHKESEAQLAVRNKLVRTNVRKFQLLEYHLKQLVGTPEEEEAASSSDTNTLLLPQSTSFRAAAEERGGCSVCFSTDHFWRWCPLSAKKAKERIARDRRCQYCLGPRDHSENKGVCKHEGKQCRSCGGSPHHPRLCPTLNPEGEPHPRSRRPSGNQSGTTSPANPRSEAASSSAILAALQKLQDRFDKVEETVRKVEKSQNQQGKGGFKKNPPQKPKGGGAGGAASPEPPKKNETQARACVAKVKELGGGPKDSVKPKSSIPNVRTYVSRGTVIGEGGEEKKVSTVVYFDTGSTHTLIKNSVALAAGARLVDVLLLSEAVMHQGQQSVRRPLWELTVRGPLGSEHRIRAMGADDPVKGLLRIHPLELPEGAREDGLPRGRVQAALVVGQDQISTFFQSQKAFGFLWRAEGPWGTVWAGPDADPLGPVPELRSLRAQMESSDPEGFYEICRDLLKQLQDSPDIGLCDEGESQTSDPVWRETAASTKTLDDGRIQVELPLHDSDAFKGPRDPLRRQAVSRTYAFLRNKTEEEIVATGEKFSKLFEEDVLRWVEGEEAEGGYSLPWETVPKSGGTPDKPNLRVVFDAAAKGLDGVSIGSRMHKGPSLTTPLVEVVALTRTNEFLHVGDIASAFHQVALSEKSSQALKIFLPQTWSKEAIKAPLRVARFSRLPMGLPPSPMLLGVAIDRALQEDVDAGIIGADFKQEILRGMYVDDCCLGSWSERELAEKWKAAKASLGRHGFPLGKEGLVGVPGSPDLVFVGVPFFGGGQHIGVRAPSFEKWWGLADNLRKLSALVSVIYDPSGFFAPITNKARSLLQLALLEAQEQVDAGKTTMRKAYKAPLKPAVVRKMLEIAEEMKSFVKVRVPRLVCSAGMVVELLGLGDASSEHMSALCFTRFSSPSLTDRYPYQIRLLWAKSKASPQGKRSRSIPSMELSSADLTSKLVRGAEKILRRCGIHVQRVIIFSDSSVVVWWLAGPSEPAGQSVRAARERVSRRGHGDIRHTPGESNPADPWSRNSLSASELVDTETSPLNGAEWMRQAEDTWPCKTIRADKDLEVRLHRYEAEVAEDERKDAEYERRPLVQAVPEARGPVERAEMEKRLRPWLEAVSKKQLNGVSWDPEASGPKISDFNSLQDLLDASHRPSGGFDAGPKEERERRWAGLKEWALAWQLETDKELVSMVLAGQGNKLSRDKQLFSPLAPGEVGPLFVVGEVCRIWLPRASQGFLKLLVVDAHVYQSASGISYHRDQIGTLAKLSERFSIPNARRWVASVAAATGPCPTCTAIAGHRFKYPAGKAPLARQAQFTRPFQNVGVDVLDRLPYKDLKASRALARAGRPGLTRNQSMLVFVCLATRAVEVDFIDSEEVGSVVLALERLSLRYGRPDSVSSDYGSQLRATRDFYDRFGQGLDSPAAKKALGRVEWTVNPPRCPWRGGSWERLVGTWKSALSKAMVQTKGPLSSEQLRTAVQAAAQVANERPLWPSTPESPCPLRPADFLKPAVATMVPVVPAKGSGRWLSKVIGIVEAFRDEWRKGYLHLTKDEHYRSKRSARGALQTFPAAGGRVLVHDDRLKRPVEATVLGPDPAHRGPPSSVFVSLRGSKGKPLSFPVSSLSPFEAEMVEDESFGHISPEPIEPAEKKEEISEATKLKKGKKGILKAEDSGIKGERNVEFSKTTLAAEGPRESPVKSWHHSSLEVWEPSASELGSPSGRLGTGEPRPMLIPLSAEVSWRRPSTRSRDRSPPPQTMTLEDLSPEELGRISAAAAAAEGGQGSRAPTEKTVEGRSAGAAEEGGPGELAGASGSASRLGPGKGSGAPDKKRRPKAKRARMATK